MSLPQERDEHSALVTSTRGYFKGQTRLEKAKQYVNTRTCSTHATHVHSPSGSSALRQDLRVRRLLRASMQHQTLQGLRPLCPVRSAADRIPWPVLAVWPMGGQKDQQVSQWAYTHVHGQVPQDCKPSTLNLHIWPLV